MKKDASRKKESAAKESARKSAARTKSGAKSARKESFSAGSAAGEGRSGGGRKARKVRFEVRADEAVHVAVAGTFNGWDPGSHPLLRKRDGRWTADLRLPPGRHQYRFVIDGVWSDLDGASGKHVAERDPVGNDFGGCNRCFEVD